MKLRLKILLATVWMIIALGSCDKYTAPSPLDGTWRMLRIENTTHLTLPIPEGAVPYWDFQNVIYSVGFQNPDQLGVRRLGFGNAYFDRDVITLISDDEKPHFFPIPSTDKLKRLQLKYRVWNGRLTLYGEGFTIYLEKK